MSKEEACPGCGAGLERDTGLCRACGRWLLEERPVPTTDRSVPLPEGFHRFLGPPGLLASYLDRVAETEKVHDRRASVWAAVCALSGLGLIGSSIWACHQEPLHWWGIPAACGVVLLLGFTRFSQASDFDLPEERIVFARTLLRELGTGADVDLTLDVWHPLAAELLEGSDPVGVQIKVGAALEAAQRRVQRQRWLLLELEGARIAATDLHHMEREQGRRMPDHNRSQTCLQLWVGEQREAAVPPALAQLGEWKAEAGDSGTCFSLRLPAHVSVTRYSSDGKSRKEVVNAGRTVGAGEARALASLLGG